MDAPAEIERKYVALKAKAYAAAPELTCKELLALQRDGKKPLVLCDVRSDAEWEVSTLPGARRRADVEAELGALAPNTTVVCFCTIGARSGAAVLALRRAGVDAVNLRGSVLSWTHEGGQLVEPATGLPTKRVHTYSADWTLQASGYDAVVFEKPPHGTTLFGLLRDKARALFGA